MIKVKNFIDLQEFEIKKELGKGAYGQVFKVINKNTKEIFAAKISLREINNYNDDQMARLRREINILYQSNHPSILKFIGYNPYDFSSKPYPVIITEYLQNNSLDDVIELERQSRSPQNWDDTKKLINIYGIASAMSYLHARDIIHRDLKPANILEDDSFYPRLGDFGLSKETNQRVRTHQTEVGMKGTPAFMSPEGLKKFEYTKEGDVYAFSILVFQLITLKDPYKDTNFIQLCVKINNGERPKFDYEIPECYYNLITRCWAENPEDRLTFADIVLELRNNKDFISDGIDSDEYYDYIQMIDDCDISDNTYEKDLQSNQIVHEERSNQVESNQKVSETI